MAHHVKANEICAQPMVNGKPKTMDKAEQEDLDALTNLFPAEKKWDSCGSAYAWLSHNEKWGNDVHVFDEIEVAKDGGLSEIGHMCEVTEDDGQKVMKDKLWYNSRYVSSTTLILFVCYNLYYLVSLDIGLIMEEATNITGANSTAGPQALDLDALPVPTTGHGYLLSKKIIVAILGNDAKVDPRFWITVIELAILMFHVLVLLQDVYAARFKEGYAKWKGVAEICWVDLPQLSIFSAIKLLEYIIPQKLSYDAFVILFYTDDQVQKYKDLALFIISRPFFLIIGMDMFLIKYRVVYGSIMKDEPTLNDVLAAAIFLNQVIGVCNVAFVIRSRLYRFVFAGEDGVMQSEELVRRDVWEAFVAYKAFHSEINKDTGKPMYGNYQACCLMLTWNDDDFQTLSLDDKDVPAQDS